MDATESTWNRLIEHETETALLGSIQSLLAWDERTGMPPKAADHRAEQISFLAGKIHARRTSPEIGEWLDELATSSMVADPHSDRGATIVQLKRDYDKHRKIPQRLVEELSRAEVLGQQAWVEARKASDYERFQPYLETNLRLRREQAEAVGYGKSPYDALIDDYEPGETADNLRRVLGGLRSALVPLISELGEAPAPPSDACLQGYFPVDRQQKIGKRAAKLIGFDFSRGRLDETAHPFCTEAGPHDHRILTRYNVNFFSQAFYGTLHEAGHGIYDQGLRPDQYGLPPGTFASLGIHESQSRLWENMVGRSRAFWEFLFDETRQLFPDSLSSVSLDHFHAAVNVVRPSLIRVEADEATYNLHIILRFELEEALVTGALAVADLPDAWNAKYEEYLGVTPPDHGDGVLQDVHWSAALFGYFPTYALGNLYAAHFFQSAEQELGDLSEQFRRGEFAPLRKWLTENIHRHGRCYSPAQLLERISGETLSHEPLLNYLQGKLRPLYGL
ncbi:MAG: carboxypeptidase M32 [Planctomycetales bacterium]|nr:carboxypeptidase M32 [Planctomycetales bacterium]